MPMRPRRICAKCTALAEAGTRYCAAHANIEAERDKKRKDAEALRKYYNSKRWRVYTRDAVLTDDPQCVHIDERGIRCLRLASDIDHVIPAVDWVAQGGDFYDRDNLRGRCHEHHSSKTAQEHGFHVRHTLAPGKLVLVPKANRTQRKPTVEPRI